MYVRIKHMHIQYASNFAYSLILIFNLNMRNQTYAYKLVQQIFAQVVILFYLLTQ